MKISKTLAPDAKEREPIAERGEAHTEREPDGDCAEAPIEQEAAGVGKHVALRQRDERSASSTVRHLDFGDDDEWEHEGARHA